MSPIPVEPSPIPVEPAAALQACQVVVQWDVCDATDLGSSETGASAAAATAASAVGAASAAEESGSSGGAAITSSDVAEDCSEVVVSSPAQDDKDKGSACCVDFGYEYEDVLTGWEKGVLDRIDGAIRTICCRPPGEVHYHKWEGMRPDVPERYQRWEGIRERNVIMGLIFKLAGNSRKLPMLYERIGLLFLYMAVWFYCYSYLARFRSEMVGCQQLWVERCVPQHLGGGCVGDCANDTILSFTPRRLSDFAEVLAQYDAPPAFRYNVPKCADDLQATDLCGMQMCSASEDYCDGGLCTCVIRIGRVKEFVKELILYMFFFKLLWFPFYLIHNVDLRGIHRVAHCVGLCATITATCLVFTITLQDIHSYETRVRALALHVVRFFLSFASLCCFEVVKGFFLGFVVGSYVIQRYCPSFVARIWKYFLC